MRRSVLILLLCVSFLSVLINTYRLTDVPKCLNADEAAFSYNAYSILQTGKDEYGNFLPVRFKSFGDYKMPLFTYLLIPFVKVFGLNDFASRIPNAIIAFLFPIAVFFLARLLFKKDSIALITSFFIAVSIGIHIVSRQAHEAYLAAFLITIATFFFFRFITQFTTWSYVLHLFFLLLSLFTYQSSRIFAIFFFLTTIVFVVRKKLKWTVLLGFIVVLLLFGATDFIYKPERVQNLLFWNNKGFELSINELRGDGGSRFMYNKLTQGVRYLAEEHLKYFSPQFLTITGDDENPRFGYPGMPPLTLVEYVCMIIGIGFALTRIRRNTPLLLLILLFFLSPITASLSWAHNSLTRSYFMLVPALIFSAYGFITLGEVFQSRSRKHYAYLGIITLLEFILLIYSWDFYFNHYPKRATVIRAWQCGYKELSDMVKKAYDKTDTFFITRENGQPYIFMLFYLAYPPQKYQQEASLTGPDEYGFGQVEAFDKFIFSKPDTFNSSTFFIAGDKNDVANFPRDKIIPIRIGTEDMFFTYTNNIMDRL